MSVGVDIRPARPEDREALIEQFLGLNVHEEPISRDRRTDRAGAVDSLDAADRKVEKTNGYRLVAERDGRIVGHIFLTFEQHAIFVREEKRDYAYVSELFVREEARGLGVVYALLKEAERLAIERGAGDLMIGVLVGNESAERAYERFGFRPYTCEMIKPLRSG
jgi:GNAT superfamily N-acetyltransferase